MGPARPRNPPSFCLLDIFPLYSPYFGFSVSSLLAAIGRRRLGSSHCDSRALQGLEEECWTGIGFGHVWGGNPEK